MRFNEALAKAEEIVPIVGEVVAHSNPTRVILEFGGETYSGEIILRRVSNQEFEPGEVYRIKSGKITLGQVWDGSRFVPIRH